MGVEHLAMLGEGCATREGKIANRQAENAITTMPPSRLLGIDFPVLPTTAMGHVLHAIELLRAANLIARLRAGRTAGRLGWRLCDAQGQPMPVVQGPCQPMLSEGVFEGPPQAQWVLSQHTADVPSLRQAVARHAALRRHLAVAIDQGQRVLTLGNGAWWAAGSGRLSGHRVALPWYWAAAFHRDHPDVVIAAGTEVCVDGPWLSAALPQDTGELVLALVAQLWAHDLHAALASVLQTGVDDLVRTVNEGAEADKDLAGLADCARRTVTAAHIASAWAALRTDVSPEEVALAALLAEIGELLLWHFAPELPLKALAELHSGRALRTVQAQQQACGFAFKQLTLALVHAWELPQLIALLIKGSDTLRANIARLADDTARHIITDPESPAIPADIVNIHKIIQGASHAALVAPLPISDEFKEVVLRLVADDSYSRDAS